MRIDDYLDDVRSVVISGHIKPDGDCIGSVLALYNYIEKNFPEIDADIYLETPSEKFRYLKNFDALNSEYDRDREYDLFVSLDCSTLDRLGKAQKYFETAGRTICIDHHESNEGYADVNHIFGHSSSACEVLYGCMDAGKLDKNIAACLYTGIVTDTGVFKYSSTSPETMRIAATLMEFGLQTDEIIDEAFYSKSWNETRILGYAMLHSELAYDGKVIYSNITTSKMEEFDVGTKELDAIVSELRQTKGVICSVFQYQTGQEEYKFSLRSSGDFNVNGIAAAFGGGGHAKAAGCTLTGSQDSCMTAMLEEVGRAIDNL